MKRKEFQHKMNKIDIKRYNGLSDEDAKKMEKDLLAEHFAEIIENPFFQEGYLQYKEHCRKLDAQLNEIIGKMPDLPMAQAVYLAPHIKATLKQMKNAVGTPQSNDLFEKEERLYEHYNNAVMKTLNGESLNIKPHEYSSLQDTIDYLISSYDYLVEATQSNDRDKILDIFACQVLPHMDLLLHM